MSSVIRRRRDGRYAIKLDPAVRALIASTAEQLAPMLEPEQPLARRIFPPAYPGKDDRTAEKQYRDLVDNALVSRHRHVFSVLSETTDADTLSESELEAWLSAVGSMRLLLGTSLDVSEEMTPPEPEDPSAPEYALYELLGQLQYLIVEVLASELPVEGRPEGGL